MIFMNIKWSLKMANIKTVQTRNKKSSDTLIIITDILIIFISGCKYKGFKWIPCKCARIHSKCNLEKQSNYLLIKIILLFYFS
jgi:hypothetical protein